MSISRRRLLKLGAGAVASAGAVMTPVWLKDLRAANMSKAATADEDAILRRSAALQEATPLGPVFGTDGRPLSYDLDSGRVLEADGDLISIRSGLGPRLLRLQSSVEITYEGSIRGLEPGLIVAGDYLDASGTTLKDMSLLTSHVMVNPLGNLDAIVSRSDGSTALFVYPRAGKLRGRFGAEELAVTVDTRTRYFVGWANFRDANGTLADALPASRVMVNGYRARDEAVHALEVYFGNQLPPDDTPQELLDAISARSGRRP